MTKTFAQKIVAIATTLTISGMMAAPVYGQTVESLQTQIQELLALVANLQSQLSTLEGGSGTGAGMYTCAFTRPLYPGVSGDDVKCLQQFLNSAGYKVA